LVDGAAWRSDGELAGELHRAPAPTVAFLNC
jgi:hypothetical protein